MKNKLLITILCISTLFAATSCSKNSSTEVNDSSYENYDDDSYDNDDDYSDDGDDSYETKNDLAIPESRYTPYESDSSVTRLTSAIDPEFTNVNGSTVICKPLGNLFSIEEFEANLLKAAPELETQLKTRCEYYDWKYDTINNTGDPGLFEKEITLTGRRTDTDVTDSSNEITYGWDS